MGTVIETTVGITATLTLNEGQLRALDALAGYGDEAFLKAFYVKLGKHYMQPFEGDLRELFSLVRKEVPGALAAIDDVRQKMGINKSSGKWIRKWATP